MKTYLITGAFGYIGSRLIKYIKTREPESQVTALIRGSGRNEEKARGLIRKKFMREFLQEGVAVIRADLSDQESVRGLEADYSHIIHCASITGSAEMTAHPVEVIESIVNATQNVLELAGRCGAASMVYLSSMEIYGAVDCSDGHRVTENELGHIELLNARSSYPLGKRMAETICYSYYKEYGVPVKIARLAQTFGAGLLPTDNRVYAQIARAVKGGRDIVLHTAGNSMGNYCGIHDALEGIRLILEHGKDGEAYNVVNEANTMTIRQMAELAAEAVSGGRSRVVYEILGDNRYGYAADTGLRLSGRKLSELGWQPAESLEAMYWDALKEMDEEQAAYENKSCNDC